MNSSELLVKRYTFNTLIKITPKEREEGVKDVFGMKDYRLLTQAEREKNIQNYLMKFEAEEWQLITTTQSQNSGTYTFIFRRSKKIQISNIDNNLDTCFYCGNFVEEFESKFHEGRQETLVVCSECNNVFEADTDPILNPSLQILNKHCKFCVYNKEGLVELICFFHQDNPNEELQISNTCGETHNGFHTQDDNTMEELIESDQARKELRISNTRKSPPCNDPNCKLCEDRRKYSGTDTNVK